MDPKEIVERIMTAHWDMVACRCWICLVGRETGCRPRDPYLDDAFEKYPVPEIRQEPRGE